MIPYKPQSAIFGWLEQGFMAGLLIVAVIEIASFIDASGTVAQKDMQISALLDIKRPVVLANK